MELGSSPRDSPRVHGQTEDAGGRTTDTYLESVDISMGYEEAEKREHDEAGDDDKEGRSNLPGRERYDEEEGSRGLEPMDFASLSDALFDYATSGLRTLVLAKRDLTEAEGTSLLR